MHLEVSRVVNAGRDKVFAAYTDFESMPKWSKRVTSVRLVRREGDTVYLENETVSASGTARKTEGKLRLTPPAKVESESEARFTKSKRTVLFEGAQDGVGTNVTASLDVEVKGLWGFILRSGVRKDVAEASAAEELASFASYVESLPG